MGSRAQVDRPLATVEAVNTVAPVLQFVHVDHLHRPVKMTNAAKAVVWDAAWLPFGGLHALSGTATMNARFPGQWFQTETGLHYNWHRSYDPTLGRYTQPDPLGFVDGPSVYGYGRGSPQRYADRDGRFAVVLPFVPSIGLTLSEIVIGGGSGLLGGYLLSELLSSPIDEPAEPAKTQKPAIPDVLPGDLCE